MKLEKKHITLGLILIFAVAMLFATRYALDRYKDHLEDRKYQTKIDAIHRHALVPEDATFRETALHLHNFVRNNSQHAEDAEFYANWPDRMKLADVFIDQLEGRRNGDRPHMECSTRSNILSALLQKEGYRVRNVVLYTPAENLLNHRIIEAQNPETKRWEAYDVTYDVFYRNIETGARVSTAEVSADLSAHEPCNTKGKCGWSLYTEDHQAAERLKEYLRIIVVHDAETNLRVALYADDVDPRALYKVGDKTGRFCDHFAKNCGSGFKPVSDFDS